jgi:hypothetical protein
MRLEKSSGVKLLGQCSLAGNGGNHPCKGATATASIKAVRELGSDGMVNKSELRVNVVRKNKSKMLTDLSQKALWGVQGLKPLLSQTRHPTGE